MRRRRWRTAAALAAALGLLLAAAPVAVAQEGPPPDPPAGPSFPTPEAIGNALADRLGSVLPDILSRFAEEQLPDLLMRGFFAFFGLAIRAVREMVGPVWDRANFITQLPLGLTLDHAWVQNGIGQSTRLALLLLGLTVALHLGSAILRSVWDSPFGDALGAVPMYVVLLFLLRAYTGIVGYALALVNAGSAHFLDPATGLPGWERMSGFDQASTEGFFAILYWLASALLLIGRVITVLVVRLLLVAGPLLIVLGGLPFALGQTWCTWWVAMLVGRCTVQVFQAFALGAGASLLTDGGSSPLDALWGLGAVWLAVILPGMLPGAGGTPGLGLVRRAAMFGVGVLTGGPVSPAGLAATAAATRTAAGAAGGYWHRWQGGVYAGRYAHQYGPRSGAGPLPGSTATVRGPSGALPAPPPPVLRAPATVITPAAAPVRLLPPPRG
jgi:hypothetical protein